MNTRIKITIPKENNKWKIQFGKANAARTNIVLAYNFVERKIKAKSMVKLASSTGHLFDVCVNYDQIHNSKNNEWINEGKYHDANEALYVLACFLEDYLPKELARDKYKKYGKAWLTKEFYPLQS